LQRDILASYEYNIVTEGKIAGVN